ncbi:MAG: ATP-binding protein [Clostridia bacterium]|nr:ATP-binding protein [Clostridia bacterium]
MGYQQDNFRRIRQEYETKYQRAHDEADRRRAEVESLIPAVAVLHRQMAAVGPEIMRISLEAKTEEDRKAAVAALKQRHGEMRAERDALLLANGYPTDYADVRYECDQCSDSGYLDDGRMCRCMKSKLVCANYEMSGLGSLLSSQSFDNYSLDYYRNDEKTYRTMQAVLQAMKQYAAAFSPDRIDELPAGGNLLLVGGTGLGKTHLSTAVAKSLLDRGYDVLYTGAIGLVASFENARFGSSVGLSDTEDLHRFYDCDLLIIDDLGTEVVNQFTVSSLYNVINTRLNLRRPTIISTNLMQDELRHRYWDRITSRLFGEFRILLFLGTDVRAQKVRRGN